MRYTMGEAWRMGCHTHLENEMSVLVLAVGREGGRLHGDRCAARRNIYCFSIDGQPLAQIHNCKWHSGHLPHDRQLV